MTNSNCSNDKMDQLRGFFYPSFFSLINQVMIYPTNRIENAQKKFRFICYAENYHYHTSAQISYQFNGRDSLAEKLPIL